MRRKDEGRSRATDVARSCSLGTHMREYGYIRISSLGLELIGADTRDFTLDELQKQTSCDTINIVGCLHSRLDTSPVLRSELLMCIDDNGKLTGKDINPLASLLYGNPYDCIVGDVVLGWTDPLDDVEPDIYKMPYKTALALYSTLTKSIIYTG